MISARIAKKDDIPDVVNAMIGFRDFLGETEPPPEVFAAGIERIMDDASGDFIIADEAAGYAQLRYKFNAWTGGITAEIEDLFVFENKRSQGVGKALVAASIERAKERGSPRLALDANENNPNAVKLYRSFGFKCENDDWWQGGRDLFFKLWF